MKIELMAAATVAAILVVRAALAGEVIGNTYISEKDGTIEIIGEAWNIKDTETPGQGKIAEFSLKQPINGITPSLQFYRLAHMNGAITPEFMLQQLRDGLTKQGMEMGAIETRRIAGKRVLAVLGSITKDAGKANFLVYMMRGEKSLYWAQFTCNVVAWEQARSMLDEMMEKVKY